MRDPLGRRSRPPRSPKGKKESKWERRGSDHSTRNGKKGMNEGSLVSSARVRGKQKEK